MPASDRLGDDEILRRLECAWSEQCGSCLNFINAEMPLILGEREALKRELLQREDSERLRMLRLIARFKRLVHEKQEAFAERDECQRMLEDLTPGGSEFYRNPIRCRNWVQDRLSSAHASTVKAVQERDALEAKVNALTAAMECRNELTSRIRALEAERDRFSDLATRQQALNGELLAERDAEVARLVASWQRAGDLLPYTLHRSECFQYVKGPGYCSCGLLDVIRDYGRAALAARGDGNG